MPVRPGIRGGQNGLNSFHPDRWGRGQRVTVGPSGFGRSAAAAGEISTEPAEGGTQRPACSGSARRLGGAADGSGREWQGAQSLQGAAELVLTGIPVNDDPAGSGRPALGAPGAWRRRGSHLHRSQPHRHHPAPAPASTRPSSPCAPATPWSCRNSTGWLGPYQMRAPSPIGFRNAA